MVRAIFSLLVLGMAAGAGLLPAGRLHAGDGSFLPIANGRSAEMGTMLPLGRPERIFAADRYAAGIAALQGRHGPRNGQWQALVRLLRALPPAARPGIVLAWLKGQLYRSDPELWDEPDHWDDIDGFLAHGGDCEEFAIAAYRLLRESGMADADLRIVLARAPAGGRDHAYVLVDIGGRTVTLDPLIDRNSFASASAYRGVVAFNAEQVWLLGTAPAAGAIAGTADGDR
ncbi:MAG: hypothetical protein D6740_13610 [Alphaproteobacteria bacterium]|nr:MAG: hypothetical protein D6740_13610 [Alphaproteobacteria bacterium]